jgi:hypothetical protein
MVVVLAFMSGALYWGSSFTSNFVHDELTAQKITFPAANSAAVTSLPAADRQAMAQYAGQPLDTGAKAETYANHFIAVHLREIGGGKTYSQASALAMAHPTDTKLAATVQTLFRGETLRGLLLNAWGWDTIATVAFFSAIGLTVATVVVFLALLYEVFMAPQREAKTVRVTAPAPAH